MMLNQSILTLMDFPSRMNTSSSMSSLRSSSKLSRTATLADGTYGFMFNILHQIKMLQTTQRIDFSYKISVIIQFYFYCIVVTLVFEIL